MWYQASPNTFAYFLLYIIFWAAQCPLQSLSSSFLQYVLEIMWNIFFNLYDKEFTAFIMNQSKAKPMRTFRFFWFCVPYLVLNYVAQLFEI